MTTYTLKHFDASATREHMEHVVNAFNQASTGQIKVTDYKVARLVVEADDRVMDEFRKANSQWDINKVTYADTNPPDIDLSDIRRFISNYSK